MITASDANRSISSTTKMYCQWVKLCSKVSYFWQMEKTTRQDSERIRGHTLKHNTNKTPLLFYRWDYSRQKGILVKMEGMFPHLLYVKMFYFLTIHYVVNWLYITICFFVLFYPSKWTEKSLPHLSFSDVLFYGLT